MPVAPAPPLRPRAGHRKRLEAVIRKRTSPRRDVQRTRIILCRANGLAHRQTKRELHTSVDTTLRWRSRYEEEGLDGIVESISRQSPRGGT